MRKQQQEQILELIETLREAQSAGLYADAQDGALAIVEYIENLEGEGTNTVRLLDEYCELLFKASKGEIREKVLRKHLIKIHNSVRDELKPNKIEIVFISYSASMSDSILSIYLAAKDDPNCNAVWLPVPFFERSADGSFSAMHYEGADCYCDNVECADWQQYDIEARRPDIIVTFSPYDECNFVTSVHPNFYCKRLRKLTDLLIYIPYFVAIDDVQEHFCTIEGCVYAHKVIVQSEKVRNTYIRVYKETFGNKFGKPEEKFVVLGSPKFDAVINTRREDCKLFDKWRELIGDKKVIFYNTSIASILAGNEQYLKKLRYVLNTFKKRDDVILWWRPHPLNEATYKSMRPQLLDEYKEIINGYKREGWGIYDESTDLNRAIAISDAYYGDWSSVVSLYQATGKPIMIRNIKYIPRFFDFSPVLLYVDETHIWFAMKRINALFKMSRTDWSPQFVGRFPNETDFALRHDDSMYQAPALLDGVLYFPAFQAREIAAYSVINKSFVKFTYNKLNADEVYHRDFYGAVTDGNYVYFTPQRYPGILRLEPKTGLTTCFSDWVEPLKKLTGNTSDCYFLYPIVVDKSIWLAACGASAVVEFNMETLESTVYEVGKHGYRYNGICYDGTNFWLSPRFNTSTPIVKWNPSTNAVQEFSSIYEDGDEKHSFTGAVYCGGFVWLLPRLSKHAYKIDVLTGDVTTANEFETDLSQNTLNLLKYGRVITFNESIYAYNNFAETFVEYNTNTEKLREEALIYSAIVLKRIVPLFKEKLTGIFLRVEEEIKSERNCYYYESKTARLTDFLNFIVCEADTKQMQVKRREVLQVSNVHADGTAGQAIYDFAKKTILG